MKDTIREEIGRFIARYREEYRTATGWRRPLVGFASAADPLFRLFQRVVSPTHSLPQDLLPEARTVIAFFFPFERSVAQSNKEGTFASMEWAKAYIETNALIEATGRHMKQFIESRGYTVYTTPPTHAFDKVKLISDWSHRHAAYAAGLGTFGHNNMLITEAGCCGRFGSFLTTLAVSPDRRSEMEACLHRHDSSCLRCVERCVKEALFEDRFDRKRCYAMCLENEGRLRELGKASVCGKCLVGLPCSFTNPVAAKGKPA